MKRALFASVIALAFSAQVALAAPKVQNTTLTYAGQEATVVVRVVGIGNADQIQVQAAVAVTCANGISLGLGLSATISTNTGEQDVTLSSGLLAGAFGCDRIVSAGLISVEVS